jgi:hypothetical protein
VLYALDGATGKELWNSGKTISSFARGGLSGGAGVVYIPAYDSTLYAFGVPIEKWPLEPSQQGISFLEPCLVFSLSATVFAQLPDGPGKDAVVKVCGFCHDPITAASVRLTRDGWQIHDQRHGRAWRQRDGWGAGPDSGLPFHAVPRRGRQAAEHEHRDIRRARERARAAAEGGGGAHCVPWQAQRVQVDRRPQKNPGVPFKKIEEKKDRLVFGIVPKKPE